MIWVLTLNRIILPIVMNIVFIAKFHVVSNVFSFPSNQILLFDYSCSNDPSFTSSLTFIPNKFKVFNC